MAVIPTLIGLILLVSTHRTVIGSPFELNREGRFNCMDKSSCSCTFVLGDYEIECPPVDPKIIVKVQPGNNVQIDCSTMDENVYLQLPVMNLGDMQRVQFRRCPLPGSGSSIHTIMDRLGIKKTSALIFLSFGASLGGTLVRQHLSGFSELERLVLSGNGLSDLPEDLFDDVGNLTWLNLRSNKVHLPVDIFKNLKKLEYLELGYNNLQSLEPGVFRYQRKLKDLNLWGNNLQHLTKDAFDGVSSIVELDLSSNNIELLQSDVFELLTNLTNINLSANRFTSLPEGLFAKNRNLSRIRMMNNRIPLETLPPRLLANMSLLEDVHMQCDLKSLPEDIFDGSINIRNLSLAQNKLSNLPRQLFASQVNVVNLDISNNELEQLDDDLFAKMRSLEILRLSNNRIANISGTIFRSLHNLQELLLDNNDLQTIHPEAFATTAYLRNLQLQNNRLSFINFDQGVMSFDDKTGSVFQYLKEIRTLNLRNNSIMNILMDWNYNNYNLNDLDLSYNNISYLSYTDINFFSYDITVNLTHNAIQEIDFRGLTAVQEQQDDKKKIKILLEHNPLRCDCIILHFIQFLQKEIVPSANYLEIITGDLSCATPIDMAGRHASSVMPRELTCLLDSPNSSIQRCPKNCSCLVRTADKALIVNCSNANLTEVPTLPNPMELGLEFTELYIENNSIRALPSIHNQSGYNYVAEIHAKNNHIFNLIPQNIPKQLVSLELTNNHLKWVNSTVFDGFNKTSSLKRLMLSRNPWACDCNAKEFLKYTQIHFKKIPDLKEIKCTDGRHFIEIGIGDLCPEDEVVIIAASVIVALLGLLIGILAALYYKFQQEVKVWMYAHNICLWFVTEEELDKDKKYDAFISYSHKDVDFVTEQIVPYLENGPHQFKLCLHDRDWVAGEFIQDSIARSVEDSRRTIVILSPNFLESIWGKMEFQVAHKNAISEGRARVIILIYGDIGDIENLDPALKSYLKTNTYVKWGDPWFWNKLRYALPHPEGYKGKSLIKNPIRSSVDDKLELIKPVPVTPPLTTPPAELAGQKFHGLNGLNGHVNGAFIINTNAKQSDV